MDRSVQRSFEELTEAVDYNPNDPAAQRNEGAEDDHGDQIDVMLRLLARDRNYAWIGPHQSGTRHHTEHNYTNSRYQSRSLRDLTQSANGPSQSIAMPVSRNSFVTLVNRSRRRCRHTGRVCITKG